MPVKFLTVKQALEYFDTLDSDEYSDDGSIICLPPDPGVVTDEEDVIENDIFHNTDIPKDVSGEVEVSFKKRTKKKIIAPSKARKRKRTLSDKKEHTEDNTESNKHAKNPKREEKKSKTKNNFNWKTASLLPIQSENLSELEETFPELVTKTPYELFCMFFDQEIMSYLLQETRRYALQKNCNAFSISENEMRRFLAIILFSGYHTLPQEELYWNNAEDCNIPFIQNAMSRQRFREIKKHLHLCNNDFIDKNDKLSKVRNFLDMFCKKLQQFGVFSECLSVDEEMVPYTGHHSAKMYMRGKPIKFGYKLWVLANSQGYPLNLQVYVGKNKNLFEEKNETKSMSLGTRVVLDLIKCVENPHKHIVYMDNFFTSLELLEEMRIRNFRMTGTIRENRLQDCPLRKSKLIEKNERGTFESIVTEKLCVVKWRDSKVVCLASNFEDETPLGQVKRWCSKEKKKIDLPQPKLISSYNKYMGGVDLLDRFLSTYRPRIKGKKWWWPFFTNTLNMAVVAAWRIHKELKGDMSQLNFLRHITTALMKTEIEKNVNSNTGPYGPVNISVRYDGINHFIVSADKQSRCKLCKKNTRMKCEKCNVMLHQSCSLYFHRKL